MAPNNAEEETKPFTEKLDLEKAPSPPEAGKFRTLLPQILAVSAKNLLIIDLAMSVAIPTIIIPALRGSTFEADAKETLTFTDLQASWFASIAYICQPIGSIASGMILEVLGRKRAMMIVNVPHIIAWTMLYFSQSLEMLFFANVLLGLGVGLMESPIITYVGEITQPSVRGVLIAVSGISYSLGASIVYFLGTVVDWRRAAMICCGVPIIAIFCISLVPETPQWLLAKKREAEAIKSLQWLRGWVSADAVQEEFLEIKRHSKNANKCFDCQKSDEKACHHPPPTLRERLRELVRKNTMKPFLIIFCCFSFAIFSAFGSMRPYYVQIFHTYNTAIDPRRVTVIVGLLSFLGNLCCMVFIKLLGKRILSICSLAATFIFCLALAIYTYLELPRGAISFVMQSAMEEKTVLPMIFFFAITFFTNVGIIEVPWMMVSEIFPYKTRGMASGLIAGLNYTMGFVAAKTYYELETYLSLFGVICLYTAIALFGTVFVYLVLPETEGRTLEEIELHFSDKKLKFTDHKIRKAVI